MDVNQNISEYVIIKGRSLLTDILSKSDISEYPIDWTRTATLPLPSEVTLTEDSEFSPLGTNSDK